MEISKKDKKAAREVIDKALQRDFEEGLSKTETILQNWRQGKQNARETYLAVYKHVKSLDKYIARRYDGMTGSMYLTTVIGLHMDKVIHDEDLVDFSEEVQVYIKAVAKNLLED
jgi:hypothetical protein